MTSIVRNEKLRLVAEAKHNEVCIVIFIIKKRETNTSW